MIEESIIYHVEGKKHVATLYTQTKEKRPIVLVAPAWMGLDPFAKEQAKKLAEQGYVGIALDVYGDATRVTTPEEATRLMLPLFIDRKKLRKIMIEAFESARALTWANTTSVAAIGFCFGGLCVLELLKSGAPIQGVVTLHGLLSDTLGETKAHTLPTERVLGKLLVLHGAQDPLSPWSHIEAFAKEVTSAHIDWEIDLYPAAHAFTNPEANVPQSGLIYNKSAADKAFRRMDTFLKSCLK